MLLVEHVSSSIPFSEVRFDVFNGASTLNHLLFVYQPHRAEHVAEGKGKKYRKEKCSEIKFNLFLPSYLCFHFV